MRDSWKYYKVKYYVAFKTKSRRLNKKKTLKNLFALIPTAIVQTQKQFYNVNQINN